MAQALENYAYIAHSQDQPAHAARLLGAAAAVREGIGTSAIGVHRLELEYDSVIAWLHDQLDEIVYNAHWSEGCAMGLEQAVAYALEE